MPSLYSLSHCHRQTLLQSSATDVNLQVLQRLCNGQNSTALTSKSNVSRANGVLGDSCRSVGASIPSLQYVLKLVAMFVLAG